jgi:hypothetical protein
LDGRDCTNKIKRNFYESFKVTIVLKRFKEN